MTRWREYDAVDAELKRGVLSRVIKARECGIPIGRFEKESHGIVTIHTVLDMLEAKPFPVEIWKEMDEVLKKIGY